MNTEPESRPENPIYQAALVTTPEEREAVFALRRVVFVEEQAVPAEEELDVFDLTATHFLVRDTRLPPGDPSGIVATARLVDKGEGVGKVGRVAVLREHRGRGVGLLLMRLVEETARARGFTRLVLDAQLYAIPFYERLGYTAEGSIFLDANIEHRFMYKSLP
ncbi:MAG TPA: GNAT family N-acetyltransferase [Chthonomonadaceae bacterium]|nr:GNAT family N-acetyltransferase [Chthonomonadaceae bacterium]